MKVTRKRNDATIENCKGKDIVNRNSWVCPPSSRATLVLQSISDQDQSKKAKRPPTATRATEATLPAAAAPELVLEALVSEVAVADPVVAVPSADVEADLVAVVFPAEEVLVAVPLVVPLLLVLVETAALTPGHVMIQLDIFWCAEESYVRSSG